MNIIYAIRYFYSSAINFVIAHALENRFLNSYFFQKRNLYYFFAPFSWRGIVRCKPNFSVNRYILKQKRFPSPKFVNQIYFRTKTDTKQELLRPIFFSPRKFYFREGILRKKICFKITDRFICKWIDGFISFFSLSSSLPLSAILKAVK